MTVQDQQDARGSGWIIALLCICSGIVGVGALATDFSVFDSALLSGRTLVCALLLWLVFRIIFLRGHGVPISVAALVIIYLSIFASGNVAASKHKKQALRTLDSIHNEFNRVSTAAPDRLIEKSADTTSDATGEYREIEEFVKHIIHQRVSLSNEFLTDMRNLGWESILDMERIRNDVNLVHTKTIMDGAKATVARYESRTQDLVRSIRQQINMLNVSENTRKGLLAGFDSRSDELRRHIAEQWRLERLALGQLDSVFYMLGSSRSWSIQGQQIVFYNHQELARFQSLLLAIQEVQRQQEAFQQSRIDQANRNLEYMRSYVQAQ